MRATPFFRHFEHFIVIGTNFTKADTQIRSRFAITKSISQSVYSEAAKKGFTDFFLLSTCNRTEFYASGTTHSVKELISQQLNLQEEDFDTYFYTYTGEAAVRHFFKVVSGLDSQIIGDYEIVCQVKSALDESRHHGMIGTITDRITNFAFQASKKVKAHTNLSSGKYSVSYAAAELMFYQLDEYAIESILIVGIGDFGSTVARNLRHYFPHINLCITNRTREKAEKLALQIRASVVPFESFTDQLDTFDAVITVVGLEDYLIHPHHLQSTRKRLFLDLSVPQAVNPAVKLVEGVSLYSVDEISEFHNELLKQRKLEIPRAEKIIEVFMDRLIEWQQLYNHRNIILEYKEKMQHLAYDYQATHSDIADFDHTKKIEKTFSELIQGIKAQGYAGCTMIEAVSTLIPVEK